MLFLSTEILVLKIYVFFCNAKSRFSLRYKAACLLTIIQLQFGIGIEMSQDNKNLLKLFQRPLEPSFFPKDDGKTVFDIPSDYYTQR